MGEVMNVGTIIGSKTSCPSKGVRGRLDPHGLVVVLSCGTLHNQHTVCGVFEQVCRFSGSIYGEKLIFLPT